MAAINFPNNPTQNQEFLAPNGVVYHWDNTAGVWDADLPTGGAGADGLSAYQIAVNAGFSGSESDWLLSIKGDKGDKGNPGKDGDKGDPGDTGATGKSAYQIALDAGFLGTEAQWLISIKGEKGDKGDPGDKGDKGDAGSGVTIVGSVPNITSLPPLGTNVGDMYIAADTGNGHVWTGSGWNDVGPIRGPKGEKGDTGDKGDKGNTGLSAYESAQADGFVGTMADWLLTLKGDKGDKGDTGADGGKGDKGDQGEPGIPGTLVVAQATAPAGAKDGDLWYNTNNGRMYVYYQDIDSIQWVVIV